MQMKKKKNPLLRKAWDFIAVSLSSTPLMAKARKPFAKKLLLFKKTKRLSFSNYNYAAFVTEYEFSPSRTPLFFHTNGCLGKRKKNRTRNKSKFFMSLLCGGLMPRAESVGRVDAEDEVDQILAAVEDEQNYGDFEIDGELAERLSEDSGEEEEEEEDETSVDKKAENFIRRFYEQMRIQRQESLLQYDEMLLRSCS